MEKLNDVVPDGHLPTWLLILGLPYLAMVYVCMLLVAAGFYVLSFFTWLYRKIREVFDGRH